tara:strand:- start:43475 stop:43936 length:462 start_codon:yes stop_codon:yes gene_type:complete
MATKRIVHLRIFKGGELNYDSQGNVKNKNQLVKLPYGSAEWRNYLTHLAANGISTVQVAGVFTVDGKKAKTFKDIVTAVEKASDFGDKKAPAGKSPLQLENEKLKAQLEDQDDSDDDIDYDDFTLSGLEKKYPEVAKKGFTSREDFIAELTKQ